MWTYNSPPLGQHLSRWSVQPGVWQFTCAILLLLLVSREYSHREVRAPTPSAFAIPSDPVIEIHSKSTAAQPILDSLAKSGTPWQYDWQRDGNNQYLAASQCDAAFPLLYHEIERAQQRFGAANITEDDIDLFREGTGNDGGVRILIVDSQVRIILTRGLFREDFRHRIIAIVQQVVQAVAAADASGEAIPNIEFSVVVDDIAVLDQKKPGALWSFTRRDADAVHDNLWLIPDFHFFAAPPEAEGFRTMQAKFRTHDSSLEQKLPQVVWRGATWTNKPVRQSLLDVTAGKEWANVSVRTRNEALLEVSSANQPLCLQEMSWENLATVIPMDEFCKYRYTVNTEGRAWSARMTHLFNCDSLMFVHDVEWVAHYYHLLDTGHNCISVARDFHDLEAKIQYYEHHLDEAQQIANRAKETFRQRYTTPAATACYWRKLMRTWSTVAFEPQIHHIPSEDEETSSSPRKRIRGITFEEFILHLNDQDYPYQKKKKNKNG